MSKQDQHSKIIHHHLACGLQGRSGEEQSGKLHGSCKWCCLEVKYLPHVWIAVLARGLAGWFAAQSGACQVLS